jgi:signal transduction histidine kinase
VSDVVIRYWIHVQIETRSADDLRSNSNTVRELENLRFNDILRSSQIIAESPRFKAVVEIGDYNTALQMCEELSRGIRSDCFFFTGLKLNRAVRLLDGRPMAGDTGTMPVPVAVQRHEAFADFWTWNGQIFRIASVPVHIGPDPVGTLTVGYRLQTNDLQSLRAMTNSQCVLVSGKVAESSTLDSVSAAVVKEWIAGGEEPLKNHHQGESPAVFSFAAGRDRFAAVWIRLDRGYLEASQPAGLCLMRPIETEVRAALDPVERTFLYLSVVILVLTAGIGYVISKGLSRPIAELVRSTTEISRGNYGHVIDISGNGELGYLATKFGEMSRALGEKISQIADRNVELESALGKLKETQEELVRTERLAATGKMTAQLSHEVNNPIHNIQSCLQTVLRRKKENDTDRELIEAAYEEAGRLAKLTRQMLDVYRNSVVPLERTPLNVNDVLEELVRSTVPSLTEHGVKLEFRADPDIPLILGARDKLKQVFLNLVINARDAMPSGGSITITTSRIGGKVSVCVADTGVGIKQQHIDRIFDAFFTTKSAVSGVGLGLTVSYGIVREHEGIISVQSTPGAGTSFSCQFPAYYPEDKNV